MKCGVTMFATDVSAAVADVARAAEARGFHSLWLPEHTHIPTSRRTPPPTGDSVLAEEYKRTLDPLVALATAAALTSTIRLGTGIALPAQREPIVTAKAVATLDHVSGGRVDFGIGYGWNADELAHHGVAMNERRAVVRERVMAMQALWTQLRPITGPTSSSLRVGRGPNRCSRACRCCSAVRRARRCSPTLLSTARVGFRSAVRE